jgi:hypothetical protein
MVAGVFYFTPSDTKSLYLGLSSDEHILGTRKEEV